MGKREDYVEDMVDDVCNNCFCNQLFDKGREILRKIYFTHYDKLDNMSTRYNLLYRLIVAERRSKKGTEKAVAMYSIQLKNDMDNTTNYKEEFTGEYLNMMSYYTECEEIKISDDELLKYYNFSRDYWERMYEISNSIDCYLRMKASEFNKALLLKNFQQVLGVVKDIHNINHVQAPSMIEQILNTIKYINEELYIQILNITTETTNVVCI